MDGSILLGIYIFIALFIAWIWVDYFRLIDIFEKENLFRVGATFLMGASSVLIVLGLHEIWPDPFWLTMRGTFLNDFLYCTFSIGLIEEVSKFLPVLLALIVFRKYINEPIDYVTTFSVGALGFAAAENVLYFSDYGPDIISSRAILSNVGHMLFASLTAYGVILVRFRNIKPGILIIPAFLLLAAIFHGIYDMGLLYSEAGWIGTIVTILFFFMGVSVFATIMNNALNISPYFTYKHVIHSSGVAVRMMIYYVVLFILQCIVVLSLTDFRTVAGLVIGTSYTVAPIVIITVIRLSRFKLIHNRWNLVRPELPFSVSFRGSDNSPGFSMGIKGDPYTDYHVNKHYETYFILCPIRSDSHYLRECRAAYIFRKMYINGDIAHYAAKIFTDHTLQESQTVLLQIKREGAAMMNNYPLVAVFRTDNADQLDTTPVPVNTSFVEWAVMKPASPH